VTETLTHDDCAVEFTLDSVSGNVLSAKLTDSSNPNCTLRNDAVEDIDVTIDGQALGLKFGQGFFQSGTSSCTTRIIGGRAISFGNPCPN
jgi:hypothetical protein